MTPNACSPFPRRRVGADLGSGNGTHEAMRDLVRARQAASIDIRKARQRIQSFLLETGGATAANRGAASIARGLPTRASITRRSRSPLPTTFVPRSRLRRPPQPSSISRSWKSYRARRCPRWSMRFRRFAAWLSSSPSALSRKSAIWRASRQPVTSWRTLALSRLSTPADRQCGLGVSPKAQQVRAQPGLDSRRPGVTGSVQRSGKIAQTERSPSGDRQGNRMESPGPPVRAISASDRVRQEEPACHDGDRTRAGGVDLGDWSAGAATGATERII